MTVAVLEKEMSVFQKEAASYLVTYIYPSGMQQFLSLSVFLNMTDPDQRIQPELRQQQSQP